MKTQPFFNLLRKSLLVLAFAGFATSNVLALQLATWNFAAWNPTKEARTTAAPTTSNANVTVSNLVMGPGFTNGAGNWFNDNSLSGGLLSATTLAEAIANNEYYEFTIQSTPLKQLSIASIDVCALSQGEVCTFSLMSSVKGFTSAPTNVISSITTGPGNNGNILPQSFAVTGHTSLTSAVTFRIYIYSASNVYWSAMGFGVRAAAATADFVVSGVSDQPDIYPPTTPGSLAATAVGATSLRLTWTASTDDNGVTGYDVYNGATLLGTTTGLFYNTYGLTASTAYNFRVIARDATLRSSTEASVSVTTPAEGDGALPKLPIGMNIPSISYYSTCLTFTDVMKSSSDMMSFSGSSWDSGLINEFTRDANGYPTVVPQLTSDTKQSFVRFLLNDYHSGRYVLTFSGAGTISISGVPYTKVNSNKYYIDFDGLGQNVWIDILTSTSGNYLKDFKILPLIYENSATYPTFNPKFIEGLSTFHAIRFMDWINTNHSTQSLWSSRITKTYYTQGGSKGASYDYAIELCNELDADAWVTIPHAADDNYITQAARLWRDGLNSKRKVYLEYSNEIWNWMFTQAGYCINNAPGHPNAYVSTDLAAIGPLNDMHPEKDAYMMARTFRIWKAEFTGVNTPRMVRVAAVQHGWPDNTRRVLNYLYDVDGQGCDLVSPGGYFNFQQTNHDLWVTQCASVTASQVCDGTMAVYDANEGSWTDETAAIVNARGLGYVCYEAGQHMQPWQQSDWCYNQAVYDAQIHPKMYDLYIKNFTKLLDPTVNCTLFMAFSYMGARESKYGSWGHLESLNQVGNPGGYKTIAPKFQALLDCNVPKFPGFTTAVASPQAYGMELSVSPIPATDKLTLNFGAECKMGTISILDLQGRNMLSQTIANTQIENLNISSLNSGVYFVKVTADGKVMNSKFVKK